MKFGKSAIAAAVLCVVNSVKIESQAQGWYEPGFVYKTQNWRGGVRSLNYLESAYSDFEWMDGLEDAVQLCSEKEDLHEWCNTVVADAWQDEFNRLFRFLEQDFISAEHYWKYYESFNEDEKKTIAKMLEDQVLARANSRRRSLSKQLKNPPL